MLSETDKSVIQTWAEEECLVLRAHVFGSRARDEHSKDSDLDIAVELLKKPNDPSLYTTWHFEGHELQKRLSERLHDFKVDLQFLDGENTPIILEGVNRSSYVVYDSQEDAFAT